MGAICFVYSIMNRSALLGREEISELERHLRSLLCSDSSHLSVLAVFLLVVVTLLRLCRRKHAASGGTQHDPVAENIED